MNIAVFGAGAIGAPSAISFRNLLLNAGHGTLGWTLACGSGEALVGA